MSNNMKMSLYFLFALLSCENEMMLTLGMNLSDWAYSCIETGNRICGCYRWKYRIDQKWFVKKRSLKTDFDSDKEVGFGLNFKCVKVVFQKIACFQNQNA
jgi:hypothetical protein